MPHLSSVFLQKPQLLLTRRGALALTLNPTTIPSRHEPDHKSVRKLHVHAQRRRPATPFPGDVIISTSLKPRGYQSRGRLGFRAHFTRISAGFTSDPSTLPPRAAVFWDLDNKQPNDVAPREAAHRLRQLASHFGREVDMLAYANR